MPHSSMRLLLLVSGVTLSTSCGRDGTVPTSPFPPETPGIALVPPGPACGPPATHPGGVIVRNIPTQPAFGIAVRDDGLIYFTDLFNGGVGVTSTKSTAVDNFIPTGAFPTGVTFAPDGATAYVTNQLSNNVGVIDVATAQQVATISTDPASPFVVRVTPDGADLYISTNTTTVFIASTATRQIFASVDVGFAPNAFAISPNGRIVYVSAFLGGTVTEIDAFSHTVLRTFNVGGVPQDMAVTRNGKRLYVANQIGQLDEIDLVTGQILTPIPLPGGGAPFGIGVTPDDNQAYISLAFVGLVQVFNLQARMLSKTLNVGGEPRRLAFSQQGHIGAVANLNGFVTLIR